MKPHEVMLEFRRKTVHLICGTVIAVLLQLQIIDSILLLALSFFFLGFFLLLKEFHVEWPLMHSILRLFEREKFIHTSPGRSVIYFMFGCSIAAFFFPLHIAVASIIILAFGDAISCLVGYHLGSIKTRFNEKKHVEGPIVAILVASIVASLFVPIWMALIASTGAMILEFPEWKIFGWHVDDNLIIPISSGIILLALGA